MISFYPGPSKVYAEVPAYVQEAYEQGLLSANHRSAAFVAMSEHTIRLLKQRLRIPEAYMVFFVSSATECWEIISQSLVRQSSFHLYNGAFGEKWFTYAGKLQAEAQDRIFDREESIQPLQLSVDERVEVIAVTHNETSNGTAVDMQTLRALRAQFPRQLIAVDATSSMAGVALDMELADIWYASVQKCFGLPAGMAVMVCSPAAIARAQEIGENSHYNSLVFMAEQMQRWQTTYTPNVLSVYLLMRTLENRPDIEATEKVLQQRYQAWIETVEASQVSLLIKNPAVRSPTVIALQAAPDTVNRMRSEASRAGIVLGNGYGALKDTTLRIANFPAIEEFEIQKLQAFLKSFR